MPRKKKIRVCAYCDQVITREIKRAKKGVPLFCSVECGIAFYNADDTEKKDTNLQTPKNPRTTVVNIRDIRVTNPDWDTDPLFVYIGRNVMFQPMKKSIFHNPFSVKKHGRKGCLEKFQNYFFKTIQRDSSFKKAVEDLRGKILVCWCKPGRCHGDIIVDYFHQPKTLENYHVEKEKEIPKMDTRKTDLIFSLIRLYEIQQDQFSFQDRIRGVEGARGKYIMPGYFMNQLGWSFGEVAGCLMSLNSLQNKIFWNGELYIESKDHYIQRNHTDYKGRVKITRYQQGVIYRLFGGQPQDFTTREVIRSR